MRAVILSNGHNNLFRLLRELRAAGVEPNVVLERAPGMRTAVRRSREHRPLLGVITGSVWALRFAWHTVKSVVKLRRQGVIPISIANGEYAAAVVAIRTANPDLVILGGCRILPEWFLSGLSCPVINAHPGLLPLARGSDVVEHSLLNDWPLGATIHFVAARVDAGGIIARALLDDIPALASIESLRERCDILACRLAGQTIRRWAREGNAPVGIIPTRLGRVLRHLSAAEREQLDQETTRWKARSRLEAWRDFASRGDDDTMLLEVPYPCLGDTEE